MLCENCGKRDATSIYLPPNTNKLKYLCGACYKKLNNENELEQFAYSQTKKLEGEKVCASCGTTYQEFEETGLFGCSECYKTFYEYIKNNFLPLFSEQKYLGKKPNLFYIESDIKNLENLIEICLRDGNFQKATIYGRELEKLKEEKNVRL